MPETLSIDSYAKINLHLDVGRKLDDGYHEIVSLFQLLSMHDRINIVVDKNESKAVNIGDLIDIKGKFSCPKESNLIYKAAFRFMDATGVRFKAGFHVEKAIPEGAGLGGGSSNAASVLEAMNYLYPGAADSRKLLEIASSVGSDVPFFLKKTSLALVKGRGDLIEFMNQKIPELKVLLVYPGFKVNTAEAYGWVDSDRKEKNYRAAMIEKDIVQRPPAEWNFINSFTSPLMKRYDIYKKIFSIFKNCCCDYFNITGSGSAAFGIFTDASNLEDAYGEISGYCPETWITNTLAGKP